MEQYIKKSALVAEIERLKNEYLKHSRNKFCAKWSCGTLDNILSFLNTLEVKEVDLEKEMSEYFVEHSDEFFSDKYKLFAKHFYELGVKAAQKGE